MICKCGAAITFAINLDSNKRIPLVRHDPAIEKAVRYRLTESGNYCKRDDQGPLMSHFGNCPNAKEFSRSTKK